MPTGRAARSRAAERSPLRRPQPSRSSTPGDTPTPKKLQRGSTKVAATQIVLLLSSSDEETSPPRQHVNPATPETVAEPRIPEQPSVATPPSPTPSPSKQREVKRTSLPSLMPTRAAPRGGPPQPAAEVAFESLFQYDSPASPPHFSGSSASSSDSDSDGLLDALTQRAGRKVAAKKSGGFKARPSTHRKETAPVQTNGKQQHCSPETSKRKAADVAVDEWLAPPPESDSERRLSGDDEHIRELRQRNKRLAELASDGARLAEEMEAAAARAQAERESPSGPEESSDKGDTQDSQDEEEASEAAAEGALVVLQLLSKSGQKHRFRVRKADPFAKLFGAYLKKVHGPAANKDEFCYVFDGDPLDPQATPAVHDMEDDDIIEVVQRRR